MNVAVIASVRGFKTSFRSKCFGVFLADGCKLNDHADTLIHDRWNDCSDHICSVAEDLIERQSFNTNESGAMAKSV